MARFVIHVVPRSSRAGPDGRHGALPRLRLAAPPTDGRANTEAERVLSDLLQARVTIVAGVRSRRKTLEVALAEDELKRRIEKLFG